MKKEEERTFNLVMDVKGALGEGTKSKQQSQKLQQQRTLPCSRQAVFFNPGEEEKEIQLEFAAKTYLDLTNKVHSFEEFGMFTPGDDKASVNCFSDSYRKCKEHLKVHDFERSLYP